MIPSIGRQMLRRMRVDSLMTRAVSSGRAVGNGLEKRRRRASRVLSSHSTFSVIAPNTFGYTIAAEQDVRLVSVRVWVFLVPGATAEVVQFKLRTGSERPGTLAEIRRWRLVLPIMVGDRETWWVSVDKSASFVWTLDEVYVGVGRRFGVEVVSLADVSGVILCSFEVEGIER